MRIALAAAFATLASAIDLTATVHSTADNLEQVEQKIFAETQK